MADLDLDRLACSDVDLLSTRRRHADFSTDPRVQGDRPTTPDGPTIRFVDDRDDASADLCVALAVDVELLHLLHQHQHLQLLRHRRVRRLCEARRARRRYRDVRCATYRYERRQGQGCHEHTRQTPSHRAEPTIAGPLPGERCRPVGRIDRSDDGPINMLGF
jgi:hypothetical protein